MVEARAVVQSAAPSKPATIAGALREAAKCIDRLDAEVLLADMLGLSRLAMLALPDAALEREGPQVTAVIPAKAGTHEHESSRSWVPAFAGMTAGLSEPYPALDMRSFAALVGRRAAGEPVAYITGHREFWSLDLLVTPAVLIPRPDSETLIEAAVAHFGATPVGRVLDLGTGSGALLLAALSQWPAATGVGVDISAPALAVATTNAGRLGVRDRAQLVAGGWTAATGVFDLILCNPPYIGTGEALPRDVVDWEPHGALFAGSDGLDAHRELAPLIGARLAVGGLACIEIGSTQADPVATLFRAASLQAGLRHDLAGLPRCLVVTK